MKYKFSSFILAFALPLALQGYVFCPTTPCEVREPTPEDFDYDLFNKDQRAIVISAEFLYWTVDEGSLDYALKMKHPAWGTTPSYAQGDFKIADFDWEPGLRVSAGYYNAPKYWEIFGEYTWLHADGSDEVKAPAEANLFLTGTWPHIFTNPLSRATSVIDLHYNLVNIFFARVFNPNPHLRMKLLGGLTFPWMDQEWKVRYFDTTDQVTFIKNEWSYWGGGPRIGFGIDWYWFCNIYITARTTLSAVVGRYKNEAKQTTSANPSGLDDPSVPVRDTHYKDTRSALNFDIVLGPSWQYSFCSSRWELFVGYEFNDWLNLQEVYRSTSGAPSAAKETWLNTGMMTLQGLTLRLTVDF